MFSAAFLLSNGQSCYACRFSIFYFQCFLKFSFSASMKTKRGSTSSCNQTKHFARCIKISWSACTASRHRAFWWFLSDSFERSSLAKNRETALVVCCFRICFRYAVQAFFLRYADSSFGSSWIFHLPNSPAFFQHGSLVWTVRLDWQISDG